MNLLSHTKTGIVSYGAYIPRYRIALEEIAAVWKIDAQSTKKGLGIQEKTVPGLDEDTVTIAINAAFQAYDRLVLQANDSPSIGAVYVGSESHPYAVKPTATIVGEALQLGNNWTAADIEFACKAGTAAMQMVIGLLEAGRIEYGLAIGADTAQGAPGDPLEYTASCASAAFILGNENVIARLLHTSSFTSDTPDFWRRQHSKFPEHGSRFTGEPAYFKHIESAVKVYLQESKTAIADYNHVVFHMPNGKFPKIVAKSLQVTEDQLKAGFLVPWVGNSYSACSMLGLAAVLDVAKPGEKILLTSYGSGAGSDSFGFEVTPRIEKYRQQQKELLANKPVQAQLDTKHYLSYGEYVRHSHKLTK